MLSLKPVFQAMCPGFGFGKYDIIATTEHQTGDSPVLRACGQNLATLWKSTTLGSQRPEEPSGSTVGSAPDSLSSLKNYELQVFKFSSIFLCSFHYHCK